MEAVECGAASLSILLGHYGKRVPLEELRRECGVSRDGSKASNIMRAARKYGMNAKGYRKDIKNLFEMEAPFIIFWNFNHFLVVEGWSKNKVYLNDPATGPRSVYKEEFDLSFTGVALEITPGDAFEPGGQKRNIADSISKRIAGSLKALLFIVLASMFLVIPGLVLPAFTRIFIDSILVKGLHSWLLPLVTGMSITALLRGVLLWLQRNYLTKLYTKLTLVTSSQFFWHILRLPVDFFAQRNAGEVGSRVQLNDTVSNMISGELATSFLNVIMIVFYIFIMVQYNLLLTVIGVVMAIINLLVLQFTARKQKDTNQKILQDAGKLYGVSMSGLQNIETLKATGSESDFFAQWSGYQAKMMNSRQKYNLMYQIIGIVPQFLASFSIILILVVGGFIVMNGVLSIGMLVAFQSLMSSFNAPVRDLVASGNVYQQTEGNLNRLDDVFNYPVDPITIEHKNESEFNKESLQGFIELTDISFGYSPLEPPLITDFNLKIKPGSRVALVGGSGSGKSTVAKLVSGLFSPWSGAIYFDGKERSDFDRAIFNHSLAMVDQDIFLFAGTISENVSMWNSAVTKTSIIQAAKDAVIHDDIVKKNGNYDAFVEENGKNFSGGQRQRLEIARALSINPSIVILDEATSALDPLTEKHVDDSLRRRGCTAIIIAHRLSTIRDCDEIIVMDSGQIVQRGSHEQLIQEKGLYFELIQAQLPKEESCT